MTKRISIIAAMLTVLFCTSFVFFYNRAQQKAQEPALKVPAQKPLPETHLVDSTDATFDDNSLRHGKVVLVFVTPDCSACAKEAQFLKTAVGKRNDITFYGVIPYGDKKSSLEAAAGKFPFKVFFDEDFRLTGKLGINRVPIKIFLEDGVIKKVWDGATIKEQAQESFNQWLATVE
ncbi:MAG: redoxin family protein [Acidobacteria bacterium]|nr:redoxin family protein [Acidobacteriota bacterium]